MMYVVDAKSKHFLALLTMSLKANAIRIEFRRNASIIIQLSKDCKFIHRQSKIWSRATPAAYGAASMSLEGFESRRDSCSSTHTSPEQCRKDYKQDDRQRRASKEERRTKRRGGKSGATHQLKPRAGCQFQDRRCIAMRLFGKQ